MEFHDYHPSRIRSFRFRWAIQNFPSALQRSRPLIGIKGVACRQLIVELLEDNWKSAVNKRNRKSILTNCPKKKEATTAFESGVKLIDKQPHNTILKSAEFTEEVLEPLLLYPFPIILLLRYASLFFLLRCPESPFGNWFRFLFLFILYLPFVAALQYVFLSFPVPLLVPDFK